MKKAYITLAVAVLVAIVVWVVERPDRPQLMDFDPVLLYPGIKDKAVRIEVTYLINGVDLNKGDDGWVVSEVKTDIRKKIEEDGGVGESEVVAGVKADEAQVGDIIDKLSELQVTTLVSVNSGNHGLYEVANLAKHVKISDKSGNILADFYIGKNGPAGSSSYIRKEGEDKVYLTNTNIGAVIPDQWSNLIAKEEKSNNIN